jgi:cytochrome c551/c552
MVAFLAAGSVGFLGAGSVLQAAETPTVTAAASVPAAQTTNQTAAATNTVDAIAAKFVLTCAGCHSVFGMKLTGPELSHVATWPAEQSKAAIKRMQEKVGPLKEEEVNQLSDLLHDARLRERLKAEEARIQAQFMAKMDPPDAAIGRALFYGGVPLRNGGLACIACHSGEGDGGSVGLVLTGVYQKMGGDTALISAIEQSRYKVMEPHYTRHPVTKQEAMHLTKYLATLTPATPPVRPLPFAAAGMGLAAAMMAGLTFYYRSQRERRGPDRLQRRRK